ncbi:MAG: nucleotidyltransferase family protein [Dehalococcoidia bacterium]
MRRDHVLRVLGEHKGEFARFGVKSLSIFGSVARDEARDDSDLDVLVEFEGRLSYDRYCGVRFFIEDLLGQKVDFVPAKDLRPAVRPYVERDAIRVA